MIKFFTLTLFLAFSISAAFAQAGKKKMAGQSAPKTVAAKAAVSPEIPAGKAQPRMITRDYIKMVSGELEYMKQVVLLSDGFALDYNPVDEKTVEMVKTVAAANDQRTVADIIMSQLPKPVFYEGKVQQSAMEYHGVLELFFSNHPSVLEQLGEKFNAAFQDPKVFMESVSMAFNAGYYTKF